MSEKIGGYPWKAASGTISFENPAAHAIHTREPRVRGL
jgi:hypothetical protein